MSLNVDCPHINTRRGRGGILKSRRGKREEQEGDSEQ